MASWWGKHADMFDEEVEEHIKTTERCHQMRIGKLPKFTCRGRGRWGQSWSGTSNRVLTAAGHWSSTDGTGKDRIMQHPWEEQGLKDNIEVTLLLLQHYKLCVILAWVKKRERQVSNYMVLQKFQPKIVSCQDSSTIITIVCACPALHISSAG